MCAFVVKQFSKRPASGDPFDGRHIGAIIGPMTFREAVDFVRAMTPLLDNTYLIVNTAPDA